MPAEAVQQSSDAAGVELIWHILASLMSIKPVLHDSSGVWDRPLDSSQIVHATLKCNCFLYATHYASSWAGGFPVQSARYGHGGRRREHEGLVSAQLCFVFCL